MTGGHTFLEELEGFLVWLVIYILVFAWSYMPIWRNSEVRQRFAGGGKKMVVTKYGWQTRKRRQKQDSKWASWCLMHPRLFYPGILWFILYVLAAFAANHGINLSGTTDGSLFIAAAVLTVVHATFFGTWTVLPFYWDMPLWGCIHLTCSLVLSVTVAALYGYLNLTGLYFYLPVLAVQLYMVVGNWIAWFAAGYGHNKETRIGNPFKAYIYYGLNPRSYSFRDYGK